MQYEIYCSYFVQKVGGGRKQDHPLTQKVGRERVPLVHYWICSHTSN